MAVLSLDDNLVLSLDENLVLSLDKNLEKKMKKLKTLFIVDPRYIHENLLRRLRKHPRKVLC